MIYHVTLLVVVLLFLVVYLFLPSRKLALFVALISLLPLGAAAIMTSVGLLTAAPLEEPAEPTRVDGPPTPSFQLVLAEAALFGPGAAFALALSGIAMVIEVRRQRPAIGSAERRRRARRNGCLIGAMVLCASSIAAGVALELYARRSSSDWNFFGPYEFWDPSRAADVDGTGVLCER